MDPDDIQYLSRPYTSDETWNPGEGMSLGEIAAHTLAAAEELAKTSLALAEERLARINEQSRTIQMYEKFFNTLHTLTERL